MVLFLLDQIPFPLPEEEKRKMDWRGRKRGMDTADKGNKNVLGTACVSVVGRQRLVRVQDRRVFIPSLAYTFASVCLMVG